MRADVRDRIQAASGTIVLQALLFFGLILGLRGGLPGRPPADPPLLVELPASPPEMPVHPKQVGAREKNPAGPPNLRARATDIVAVPPMILLPQPIIAAPVADAGLEANSGAADLPGTGIGAGGRGDGRGGGGDGTGGTAPRHLRGSLRNSDYPRAASEAGAGGTVGVRYRVGVDGRVSQCLVTRSSGNDALDAATCSLIERRFRFAPARDEAGRPVASTIVENHSWFVEQVAPEPNGQS
jgi:protein TonB